MAQGKGPTTSDAQMSLAVLFTAEVKDTQFNQAITKLRNTLESINSVLKGVGASSTNIAPSLNKTGKGMQELSIKVLELRSKIKGLNDEQKDKATPIFKKLAENTEGMQKAFVKAARGVKDLSIFEKMYRMFDNTEKSLLKQSRAAGMTGDAYQGVMTQAKMLSTNMGQMTTALNTYKNQYADFDKTVKKKAIDTWKQLQNLPNMFDPEVRGKTATRLMKRYLEEQGALTKTQTIKNQRIQKEASDKALIRARDDINAQAKQYSVLGTKFKELSKEYAFNYDKTGSRAEYIKSLQAEYSLYSKGQRVIEQHQKFLEGVRGEYGNLTPQVNALNDKMLAQGATYAKTQGAIRNLVKEHKAQNKELADAEKWVGRLEAKYGVSAPKMAAAARAQYEAVQKGQKTLGQAQIDFGKSFYSSQFAERQKGLLDFADTYKGKMREATLESLKAKFLETNNAQLLKKGLREASTEYSKQQTQVQKLNEWYRNLNQEAKKYPESLKAIRNIAKTAYAGDTSLGMAQKATGQILKMESAIARMQGKFENILPKQYLGEMAGKLRSGSIDLVKYRDEVNGVGYAMKGLKTQAEVAGGRFASLKGRLMDMVSGTQATIQSINATKGAMRGLIDAHEKTIRVQEQAKKSSNWMVNWASDIINKMRVLADYAIGGGIIYGLFSGLQQGKAEIIAFSQTLANLQAITGATSSETAIMGETIKNVSRNSRYSTAELGSAMTLLGQAGFTASESTKGLDAVAKLSTGTLETMASTVDLLATSIRAFGLPASDFNRVADVMANAINKSKLTVEKLRISFGYMAVIAKQAGVSLEETAASAMVLGDAGLRASTIGTSFRQVLGELINPSHSLKQRLADMKIGFDDLNPSMVGYGTALENLMIVLTDTKTGVLSVEKAMSFFGQRGAQAALILANAYQTGAWKSAIDKTYEVGAASKMAATQMGGLQLKIDNMVARLKLLAVSLGESGIAKGIGEIVDIVGKLATVFEGFSSKAGKIILELAGITMAVTALIVALRTFGSVLTWLANGKIIGWALSLAKGNAYVVAATALIGALVYAYNRWGGSIDDNIIAQERQVIKAQESLSIMKDSIVAMEAFEKQQDKGNLSSKEYTGFIQRLIEQLPELKNKLSESSSALKTNLAVMKEQANISADKTFKALSIELELYKQKIKEAQAEEKKEVNSVGVLGEAFNTLKFYISGSLGVINRVTLAFEKFFNFIGNATGIDTSGIVGKLREINNWFVAIANSSDKTAEVTKETADKLAGAMAGFSEVTMKRAQARFDTWTDDKKMDYWSSSFQDKMKTASLILESQGVDVKNNKKEVEDLAMALYKLAGRYQQQIQFKRASVGVDGEIARQLEKQYQKQVELFTIHDQIATLERLQSSKGQDNTNKIISLIETRVKLEKELAEIENKRLDDTGEIKKEGQAKKDADVRLKILEIERRGAEDVRKAKGEQVALTTRMMDLKVGEAAAETNLAKATAETSSEYQAQIIAIQELSRNQVLYRRQLEEAEQLFASTGELRYREQAIELTNKLAENQRGLNSATTEWMKTTIDNDKAVKASKDNLMQKELDVAKAMSGPVGSVSKADIDKSKLEIQQEKVKSIQAEINATQKLKSQGYIDVGGKRQQLTAKDIDYLNDKLLELYGNLEKNQIKIQSSGDFIRDNLGQIGGTLINDIANGFGNLISGTESFADSVKQMAQSVIADIVKMIAKLLIYKALWATVGKTESGASGLNAMGIVKLGGAVAGAVGGGATPAANMQQGPNKKQMGMMQSMFNPKAMAMNPALMASGGSQSPSYIININATDAQSFSKMLATKSSQEMIAGAVTNKFTHNAPIRKTLKRK